MWLKGETGMHFQLQVNYCEMLCIGQRSARTRKSTTEELGSSDGEAIESDKPPTPPPSLPDVFPVTPKATTASYSTLFVRFTISLLRASCSENMQHGKSDIAVS